ncbi:MAG: thioredoxin domain-containing protein [Anaerolineae bacterium]|nr:thioredoxin domain-containing protein [Anaerolineae bacterium]
MPNRLQHETSPYLLQHADNPVEWYPWGDEAFAAAQAQNKPILLSVGYSACHWCHVMAHESFEDDDTAAYMNEHFICIKVDREERPDVDDIYMQATLLFNRGNGGWPMTVFMTPEGHPFHAGTYYPPEARYGMPSFRQVMELVIDSYRKKRKDVERTARGIANDLSRSAFDNLAAESDILTFDLLDAAAEVMLSRADPVHGGLTRGGPKFPSPVNLEYLLRYHVATNNNQVLQAVLFTLRKMAEGGMYDQLGGGFHRYSVDEKWLVPHFEKMLYDNAQLARVYLHAWQISGEAFFREIVIDTLDYVMREMTDDNGGFYSTQDADSEGEEGKFFVWAEAELRESLAGVVPNVDAVLTYWGVTRGGNFEGKNILHAADMMERVAVRHGLDIEQMRADVNTAKTVLFTLRKNRIAPGRDEKMLAAWNGMMLAAFAEAARVLDHELYRRAAVANAEFLQRDMMNDAGRLWRSHKDGISKINGYLEDYAQVIDGLLELYQTTFDARWFIEAQRLAEVVLEHFESEDGGFYDTSDDHDELIVRPRNVQDNATPSGNAMMGYNLLRLTGYSAETRYEDAALTIYRALGNAINEYPMAFGQLLTGLDMYLRRPVEIALIGDLAHEQTRAMLDMIRGQFRPLAIVAHASRNADGNAMPALLRHRTLREGDPAAYVCENFVCAAPVTTADDLKRALTRQIPLSTPTAAPFVLDDDADEDVLDG